MDERTCVQCGASTEHLRSDAKFCRTECRNRWHRELRTGGPTAPRDCARCGETYTPVKRDGVYCSQRCGNLARHDARRPPPLPPKACVECGRMFSPMRGGERERCSNRCRARLAVRNRTDADRAARATAAREWARAHPERARAGRAAYYRANPERFAQASHIRRARKRAAGVFVVTERDWLRLVERYRGCCAYCGKPPAGGFLHREHVIPIVRGGQHSIGNLLPACPPCNLSKGRKTVTEWRHREGVLARVC